MHYIRFLKTPKVSPGSSPELSARITVTTDLGESFLCIDISLSAEVWLEDGTNCLLARIFRWKGGNGMRSLDISLPISSGTAKKAMYMLIRPGKTSHQVDTFIAALGAGDEGGVVSVQSMSINSTRSRDDVPLALRRFTARTKMKGVSIWEETGESIARHIWDAGLLVSSYLATISPLTPSTSIPGLPNLEKLLAKKNLKILELGAGCGIVGITLSSYFPTSQVLLTDLPEATEIIERNLDFLNNSKSTSTVTHEVLDWSKPLSSSVSSTDWDLILVADCTYNPDVVPDLASTLKAVVGNETLVLLAMKVRHDSELIFFDLMAESGFVVDEKFALPLAVLGGEDEEIEIFVFRVSK